MLHWIGETLGWLSRQKQAMTEIGADFAPDDMRNKVERTLMRYQWEKDGKRWRHEVFREGFFLHNVLEDNQWRKIARFLRVSWRHFFYHQLTNSHRHELNVPDTELHNWDYSRLQMVKEWTQQHGGKLPLSIGAMMSGKV